MLFPIHIQDHGRRLVLDYEQFLDYHGNHALAGATVAWRALEQAAIPLSEDEPWDRSDLIVGARHAGPGVRDALEYVTRCFTRERFSSEAPAGRSGPCGSAGDFHFTVSDGGRVVQVVLREDVISDRFFAAVHRCRLEPGSEEARAALAEEKVLAAAQVCRRDLGELFACRVTTLTVEPGRARA